MVAQVAKNLDSLGRQRLSMRAARAASASSAAGGARHCTQVGGVSKLQVGSVRAPVVAHREWRATSSIGPQECASKMRPNEATKCANADRDRLGAIRQRHILIGRG